MMDGRETQSHNDLFYLCSLVEFIARKTKNPNRVVVNALGAQRLQKIYDLADVYHSDNIERVAFDFIEECGIEMGQRDVTDVKYSVPSYWDIGKVYKRLIIKISDDNPSRYIAVMIQVFNSWIADRIDDYNSSFYYSSPDYIYQSYLFGEAL